MTNYLGQLVLHVNVRENYFFQNMNALEEVKGLLLQYKGDMLYSELQGLFKFNILGREGGPRLFTIPY